MKRTAPKKDVRSACELCRWKGRDATKLSNGAVELVALSGGGHLAAFRFAERYGIAAQNVLWEAPWETADPPNRRFDELSQIYGSSETSKFLAGYTGHAVCLDYFGLPSLEEAARGLPLHGEAAIAHWNVTRPRETNEPECQWNVRLPVAQLNYARTIRLGTQESVAYIEETVSNLRSVDHSVHWVQHATFGPPFLNAGESTLAVSALRGMTSPLGYEGYSLLASDQEFVWPHAPREDTTQLADLRQPFSIRGRGFLATLQFDRQREVQFVLAINWKLRLGMGYCFRRTDFPWVTVWEENCVRQNTPWSGNAQVRGMEFGTTPLPLGRKGTLRQRSMRDNSYSLVLPAHGTRTVHYVAFLFTIPAGIASVENAEVKGSTIVLGGKLSHASFSIPANGCEDFLASVSGEEQEQCARQEDGNRARRGKM